ncbi:MAG: aminotransferase class I/II-fold pyridoxal phosphate-dependent enzyme [Gemmatimonadota bacterium]|jgi:LL-diaminopimelate aminotransferase|nr:aminotransferase class I/II-fold pyridoxal phosphate-dependent enzyme [Gemmatimonadota bacterium]
MSRAADRIAKSRPYIFQTMNEMQAKAVARGVDVIDLGVGNPDLRPDDTITRALHDALDDPAHQNHRYPPFDGISEFREAIASWYDRRFSVTLDPDTEVLPVIGTKEGIGHLYLALLNPGDTLLVPTPCYPAYLGAAGIAQAEVQEMPLLEENGFLIDVNRIPDDVANRAKMMLVNYPGNPTGAVCDLDHYREILTFAERHDIVIVSDIAYADLTLDEDAPAPSFLEIPEARSRTVEFYSFSKTFSMAGWRVGFLAGNAEIRSLLLKVKSNLDFGVFMAVQRAAAQVLLGSRRPIDDLRGTYRARRDLFVAGLAEAGWEVTVPPATLYLWTRIPRGFTDSVSFVTSLFDQTGVLISPGAGFGDAGEGFCRISLIIDEERVQEAVRRIRESGILNT